jgi:alpha-tubulin suppressor-like RCC1 family protein
MAVDDDGAAHRPRRLVNAFSFGSSDSGQCCHGNSAVAQSLPRPIFSLGATEAGFVRAAACGSRHTVLLTNSGAVLASGAWDNGRLGAVQRPVVQDPDTGQELNPVPASLRPSGSIYAPAPVRGLSAKHQLVAVACGSASSYAVASTGEGWVWGSGKFGCLGLGDELDRWEPVRLPMSASKAPVKQLSAGQWFCVALCAEGKMYAWGANAQGQCGVGRKSRAELTPVLVNWAPMSQAPLQVDALIV